MTWTMTMWTEQMMNPTEPNRGIDYADGGVSDLNVYYPNPDAIRRYHEEWDWLPEHQETEFDNTLGRP